MDWQLRATLGGAHGRFRHRHGEAQSQAAAVFGPGACDEPPLPTRAPTSARLTTSAPPANILRGNDDAGTGVSAEACAWFAIAEPSEGTVAAASRAATRARDAGSSARGGRTPSRSRAAGGADGTCVSPGNGRLHEIFFSAGKRLSRAAARSTSCRAAWILEWTVPTGMPRVLAISADDFSSISNMTKTTRLSSES